MSYIGLVAHCAALAVQHDMDKAKAADREVDETQAELAIRWMIDAGAFGFSPQQIVAMRAKKAD